jgi:hypothetical protein
MTSQPGWISASFTQSSSHSCPSSSKYRSSIQSSSPAPALGDGTGGSLVTDDDDGVAVGTEEEVDGSMELVAGEENEEDEGVSEAAELGLAVTLSREDEAVAVAEGRSVEAFRLGVAW